MARTKRLTFDVGEKFDELLTRQSASAETTKAEFIRRAVATYSYLRDAGKPVFIDDGDGKSRVIEIK